MVENPYFCRLCLSSTSELIPVFDENPQLSTEIYLITRVKVNLKMIHIKLSVTLISFR